MLECTGPEPNMSLNGDQPIPGGRGARPQLVVQIGLSPAFRDASVLDWKYLVQVAQNVQLSCLFDLKCEDMWISMCRATRVPPEGRGPEPNSTGRGARPQLRCTNSPAMGIHRNWHVRITLMQTG